VSSIAGIVALVVKLKNQDSHHFTGFQLANNAGVCFLNSFDLGACQIAPVDSKFVANKSTWHHG